MNLEYRPALVLAAALSMALAWSSIDAAETARPAGREIIPGSELMTSQERERYRQRIRGAKSDDDEARIRTQHVEQMRERARLRGLRLAEPEPAPSR